MKHNVKKILSSALVHILLLALVFINIFPLYWMVTFSLKTNDEIQGYSYKDAETGQARWINTSGRRTRTAYADWFTSADRQMEKLLLRHHVDSVDIATDGDYVRALMGLFEKR